MRFSGEPNVTVGSNMKSGRGSGVDPKSQFSFKSELASTLDGRR
jgi:hypothetical protein